MNIPLLVNCARCGENHEHLEMFDLNNHPVFTHFANCPVTNQPIFVSSEQTEPEEEIKLDAYHYHEALERAWLCCEIIEKFFEHPVIEQHKDLSEQKDKILEECAELYQMIGQKDEAWIEDELLPDIRNKLSPMLALAAFVEEGHYNNPKFVEMMKETAQLVKENVKYIANANSTLKE